MGKTARPKPDRLPAKLRRIRKALGLSQTEMLAPLGIADELFRSAISGYELGTREPPLPTLLEYARLAGVCLDILVDDDLNLPQKLPSTPKHEGVKHRAAAKSRGKR